MGMPLNAKWTIREWSPVGNLDGWAVLGRDSNGCLYFRYMTSDKHKAEWETVCSEEDELNAIFVAMQDHPGTYLYPCCLDKGEPKVSGSMVYIPDGLSCKGVLDGDFSYMTSYPTHVIHVAKERPRCIAVGYEWMVGDKCFHAYEDHRDVDASVYDRLLEHLAQDAARIADKLERYYYYYPYTSIKQQCVDYAKAGKLEKAIAAYCDGATDAFTESASNWLLREIGFDSTLLMHRFYSFKEVVNMGSIMDGNPLQYIRDHIEEQIEIWLRKEGL